MSTEPISVFSELKPGKMLLGCSYGLLLFDKESGERTELLMGVSVRDILVVNDDVWICTGGDGVIRYNHLTNTTEKINSQSGLPSNFVNSIVASGDYLFIGTESGLCRLSPNTNSVQVYPSIYSLSRTSFNKASHFKLQNGQLAWGTNNGAVIFEPLLLMNVPSNGTIFFQDLSVSGRSVRTLPDFELNTSVDSLKSLSLKHFQNTFSLELLPLQTLSGAKFSWKLDGFDKDWSLPSDNRMVTYTNLPSGDFVLNVRLYDSSLSRIIHERSVAISVVPPFWKSLWFWGLVYLVLIGLALLVLQYYLKSLHQKHTEEKVRFFTNTAHDIRTSLTLIKAPVEELSRETNLSDDGRHYLSIAIEQARRLSTVVTQLMDFQKVDIGKEQLTLAMVDLVLFIDNRLSMFESLAKSKNIDFVFTPSVKSYLSAIDESKMEKIVDNLISNAIKYSNTDNKVLVEFNVKEKEWSVLITDFGIGMSKDVQRRLFKEFFRGENAINSKVVGSGIGLLMAKDYVSLHNGTITCYSQEGVGSKFLVTIPCKYVNAEAVANSMQTNSSHLAETSFSETFNDASGISDIGSDIQEPEMKVLIVEDNDDLLAFMKRTLSRYFVVCTAENGQQALEVIEEQMPDLVVSDIMMPGMDGFELCEKLKSSYETAHIPVVLLTALSEKSEQLKGLGLGADDYLTKPFDMNLLVQRIKSIIRNRIVVREKALKLIKVDVTEPILANELNDRFMKRLLEVAKLNIGNSDFNKDDFAFAMNVSSSLLYKKVKSLTNLSPTDLIKVVRLEHALELLQARQYTVTEISEMCGFASVGYFGTVFRKHFGKLPTEILEQ
jgi:signal transduction histidine kinase/CheY-like chemotaxis protein